MLTDYHAKLIAHDLIRQYGSQLLHAVGRTTARGRGVFAIHYRAGIEDGDYEPDFVVETKATKYLCEPKRKDALSDPVVIAKAEAASEWCRNASEVTNTPWRYLLISHDVVDESKTLTGLAATYEYRPSK